MQLDCELQHLAISSPRSVGRLALDSGDLGAMKPLLKRVAPSPCVITGDPFAIGEEFD